MRRLENAELELSKFEQPVPPTPLEKDDGLQLLDLNCNSFEDLRESLGPKTTAAPKSSENLEEVQAERD